MFEQEVVVFDANDVESNKTMGIVAYFIFFLPLLLTPSKESPYARFHCNQALLIFLTSIAFNIVGSLSFSFISYIGSLAVFALWILGLINAINGEAKRLPLIGGIELIK